MSQAVYAMVAGMLHDAIDEAVSKAEPLMNHNEQSVRSATISAIVHVLGVELGSFIVEAHMPAEELLSVAFAQMITGVNGTRKDHAETCADPNCPFDKHAKSVIDLLRMLGMPRSGADAH